MPRAMEVLNFTVTNPNTTLTAVVMNSGDSNTIRNFAPGSRAWLEDHWALNATLGYSQVKSARMHDNLVGIQSTIAPADPTSLWPEMTQQILYPQDTLTILQSGEASGVDAGALLVCYDDLPGSNAVFATLDQVRALQKNVMAVPVTVTSSGTAGLYSSAAAINSTSDTFKANSWYAILGYLPSVAVNTVGIRSPDFGNYRVGGPGPLNHRETRDWFVQLDKRMDGPCIPCWNAANKYSTFVDITAVATSSARTITFFMAELGSNIPGF